MTSGLAFLNTFVSGLFLALRPLVQGFFTILRYLPLVGCRLMVEVHSEALIVEGFLLFVVCLRGFVYTIASCCM